MRESAAQGMRVGFGIEGTRVRISPLKMRKFPLAQKANAGGFGDHCNPSYAGGDNTGAVVNKVPAKSSESWLC